MKGEITLGIERKYGKITTEKATSIGENEPVFLIRAQDKVSVNALWKYLECFTKATRGGEQNDKFIKEVEDSIKQFEAWQKKNNALVKLPD